MNSSTAMIISAIKDNQHEFRSFKCGMHMKSSLVKIFKSLLVDWEDVNMDEIREEFRAQTLKELKDVIPASVNIESYKLTAFQVAALYDSICRMLSESPSIEISEQLVIGEINFLFF